MPTELPNREWPKPDRRRITFSTAPSSAALSWWLWCKVLSSVRFRFVVSRFPDVRRPVGCPNCWSGSRPAGQLSDLELILLDLLRQLDTADRHGRRLESLETQHWPGSLLHPPMVLLDHIIQVLDSSTCSIAPGLAPAASLPTSVPSRLDATPRRRPT